MTGKLAGIPYCSEAALAAAATKAGAAERATSSCSGQEPRRQRHDRPPAPARRRCGSTARSSSQAPTTGLLSPWQWSPPPRPGRLISARSWCGWRCSSTPKRRRSTPSRTRSPTSSAAPSSASARSTSASTARDFTLNPTSCETARRAPGPCAAAAPTRPTRRRSAPFAGRHPLPDHRLRRAQVPAEADHAALRRSRKTKRDQHPKFRAILIARAGDANIAPRRGDAAALAVPRPGPHPHDLHPGPARRRSLPGAGSIYGYARAKRRCSTTNSPARSIWSPRTTRCRTCSPTCAAR